MSIDLIIGLVLIFSTICILTMLVLWSRKTIDRIAESKMGSLREIQREINDNGKHE